MRMSVSRLAALGAALLAGATLAACSSSGVPFAPTGNNNQVNSFPGAPVRFIQGSPNLHLGLTSADFYVDGQKVVTLSYGAVTPDILSLPAGSHTVTLYQVGTTNPLFSGTIVVLNPNTKYAIVVQGDAGAGTVKIVQFTEAHYNTPAGIPAVSVFNASPRAGTVDFLANAFNINTDTVVALSVGVDASKTNVILVPSPNYCISAYHTGTTTPLVGGYPSATSNEHTNTACTANLPSAANGQDVNIYLIDFGAFPATTSEIVSIIDQNG